MTKHVPGKMKVKNGYIIMDGENREELARTLYGIGLYRIIPWKEAEANADFIVKACNCHDELLGACKDIVLWFKYSENSIPDALVKAEIAIANAESEE